MRVHAHVCHKGSVCCDWICEGIDRDKDEHQQEPHHSDVCVSVSGSPNDGGKEGPQSAPKGSDPFVVDMLLVSSSFVVAWCFLFCCVLLGSVRKGEEDLWLLPAQTAGRWLVGVVETGDGFVLLVSVGVRVCLCGHV